MLTAQPPQTKLHQIFSFKKSSLQISLVLFGSLTIMGCDRHFRYEYDKRDDCISDWGEMACKNRGYYYPSTDKQQNFIYCTSSNSQSHHAKRVVRTNCNKKIVRSGFGSRGMTKASS